MATFEKYKGSSACARCGVCNGGPRRWKIRFAGNRSAYICAPCIERVGGSRAAVSWLERNAIFGATGKLLGFEEKVGL